MKKFSNISNVKVSEEPKVEVKQLNEEEMFKVKVMNLMEQLLSIRTYGPIDRYLRAGSIKVAGKEMFLEALMDLLKDKSSKEEKKILESLKSSVSDWETIDSKIDEVNQKIAESQEKEGLDGNYHWLQESNHLEGCLRQRCCRGGKERESPSREGVCNG